MGTAALTTLMQKMGGDVEKSKTNREKLLNQTKNPPPPPPNKVTGK